jgi:hypothetical protein
MAKETDLITDELFIAQTMDGHKALQMESEEIHLQKKIEWGFGLKKSSSNQMS